MTLRQYLKQNGMSQVFFSKKIGVTAVSVYRYCKGSKPSNLIIKIIEKETNGLVTNKDFIELIK